MANGWRYSLTFRGQNTPVPEGQSVLGRSRHADVQIPEPSVSRKHLRIVTVRDAIVVEDIGASNGTYVNEAPIYGRTTVRNGDRLAIGDAELEVSITPIAPPEVAQTASDASAQAGHGAATMFLQQQSIDLALQVEGGSPPQHEISPEEALEALGQAFPGDDIPTVNLEESPTQGGIPTQPAVSLPPEGSPPALDEPGQFATMAIDRSMFEDLELSPDLAAPAPTEAATEAVAHAAQALHDETHPAFDRPLPPGADSLSQQQPPFAAPPPVPRADSIQPMAPPSTEPPPVPASHLASAPLAWREDTASEVAIEVPPAPPDASAKSSSESTTVGTGWGAMAFDAVKTPPPMANPTTMAPPAATALPAAGLGPRVLAWLIDLLWITALSAGCWLGLGLRSQPQGWQQAALIGLGLGALVILTGWSLVGTTPGKRILGLFVCTPEGQPGIGLLRAMIRGTVWLLSALPLGIVFLMAVIPGGRALHDRLAGTYVGRRAS